MHVNVGGMCQFHTAGPENEPAIKEEGSQVPSTSASRGLVALISCKARNQMICWPLRELRRE